jgi:hypothetical protein
MERHIEIPQGNEKIAIQLTVKELLALSGENFYQDHKLLIEARKKLRQQLEVKNGIQH